ncbi:MAG: DNA cytosine methyltransferase [Candidatus Endonucleobacter sp. (ex Gigantidas childressi)]|nr:DNA cytosine methyltransferase [Candidatus Endonucleobacter sp. (ex Gigantidas childressi)]
MSECSRQRSNLKGDGYKAEWRLLNASDYGVSQLRPRVVIVAIRNYLSEQFSWPQSHGCNPLTVGELLEKKMSVIKFKPTISVVT